MATFILIPGLLSDERVWAPLAERLRPLGEVVHADISMIKSIPDAAEELLAAHAGDLVPIGHSLGGRIAFEMAHQGGDRISAVIAANTGHDGLQPGEEAVRLERITAAHEDLDALVASWLPPMLAPSHRDTPLADDLREMALKRGADAHERQIRALINRPVATDYLPAITAPALLLSGTEDTWSPPADHERMAELMPNAELHVVEGSGHFLPVEKPDALAEYVLKWLERRLKGSSNQLK